jgi:hypothetical protein
MEGLDSAIVRHMTLLDTLQVHIAVRINVLPWAC